MRFKYTVQGTRCAVFSRAPCIFYHIQKNEKMKKIYISAICLLLVFQLTAQNKYYVRTNGFSNGSGRNWNLAMNDIQKAVDTASPGDFVYVAAGTYKGGFFMKDGVTVLGGYTANVNNPEERIDVKIADPSQQSILSGEGKQRVITQYVAFTQPTSWDGFVIQNGKPSGGMTVGSVVFADNQNAIVGVIYKYDTESNTGMMIGTEEVQKQWGGYLSDILALPVSKDEEEARADLSGLDNSSTIVNELKDLSIDFSTENYDLTGNYAAYWCDTLNTGGYSDWHLPSVGEMQEIYDSNINGILKGIGRGLQNGYWSSSHVGDILAWTYHFECGHLCPVLKYVSQGVRAIHSYDAAQANDISVAGGGAFLSKNGILKNCIIKNNQSSSKGGGVYAGRGSSLIDCIVEGNNAPDENEIYYESGGSDNLVIIDDKQQIRIYPNPVEAGGNIGFQNFSSEQVNIRILDATGKIISTGNLSGTTVTAPQYPGIYFIQLQYLNNNVTSKLVVY